MTLAAPTLGIARLHARLARVRTARIGLAIALLGAVIGAACEGVAIARRADRLPVDGTSEG